MKEVPNLPKQLMDFIKLNITSKYIGVLPTDYADMNNFIKMQEGYRFNTVSGECLVSNKYGGWQDSWYVFANNTMDDPFYIDFTQEDMGFPIYFSYHGAGMWQPNKVADSLAQFEQLLRIIKHKETTEIKLPFNANALSSEIDLSNEFWAEVNQSWVEMEEFLE
jgi:hypothetical protein